MQLFAGILSDQQNPSIDTTICATRIDSCFLKKGLENAIPFWGPLVPLVWTFGEVCPGFQSQGGSLACVLFRLFSDVVLSAMPPLEFSTIITAQ